MRRAFILTALLAASSSLSGCAMIGDFADRTWNGVKSVAGGDGARTADTLRDAPDQPYVFADGADTLPDTVAYADARSPALQSPPAYVPSSSYPTTLAGYDTGLYYGAEAAQVPTAAIATPGELSYVRLNGNSDMQDWRNCEIMHRGYWLVDAAGGRINPEFEVCLRNKGYVRESELAVYGLRGQQPVRGANAYGYGAGYTAQP